MVCKCGHMRSEHEYGKDYGAHGYMCSVRTCSCEYYSKKYTKKIKEVIKN